MATVAAARNRLISMLPYQQQELLYSKLERVSLAKRMVLSPGNRVINDIYFLESGLACATWLGLPRQPIDVLLVGRDGLVGASLVLGVTATPFQFTMLTSGTALRMSARDFVRLTTTDAVVRMALLRYTAHLMFLLAQTATCNAAHRIHNRLPSLILRCSDQIGSPHILLSHQALGHLLGVRRSSISEAISVLECKGAIQTGHAHIAIVSRDLLVAESCECYQAVQRQARAILGYAVDGQSEGHGNEYFPVRK